MKPLTPRHLYQVRLEDEQVDWLKPEQLPPDWMAYPHAQSTQMLGDSWVEKGEKVALAVPSVLAPQEFNVMLNCNHPAFRGLNIGEPETFPFNPRLTPDAGEE